MDLHLSVSGALTGDMIIAAILDAFPQYEELVVAAIDAVDGAHPVACALLAHANVELTGRRFEIVPFERYFGHIPFAFSPQDVTWDSVNGWLREAHIRSAVRQHAAKMLELIALSESRIPALAAGGTAELTPWYVTSQVVGAAALIDALGAVRWTVAPLPDGATATLTAAAILDYLCPPPIRSQPLPRRRSLARNGTGFGSPPVANSYLRVLCFDAENAVYAAPGVSSQVPLPGVARTGQPPAQ